MTHIGIYAKTIDAEQALTLAEFIEACRLRAVRLSFFATMYKAAIKYIELPESIMVIDDESPGSCPPMNFLVSMGGDGTLLEAARIAGASQTPIVGINLGRLGFLASIEKKYATIALDKLLKGDFVLEQRSLLHLTSNENHFALFPYALNDMTLIKRDHSSMVIIHVTLNGEFLNSYWADGVILSTPTGSTGYNLSSGGPILIPTAPNFVITPIAPHNLNVRPLVLPDTCTLEFTIEGRTENFLCTLDSGYEVVSSLTKIKVQKAPFAIQMVRLPRNTFLKTLRDKLLWGRDARNYKKIDLVKKGCKSK